MGVLMYAMQRKGGLQAGLIIYRYCCGKTGEETLLQVHLIAESADPGVCNHRQEVRELVQSLRAGIGGDCLLE